MDEHSHSVLHGERDGDGNIDGNRYGVDDCNGNCGGGRHVVEYHDSYGAKYRCRGEFV